MANHIIKAPKKVRVDSTAPDEMEYWPSWRYNPKNGQGQIFNSEEEVPDGWVEHFAETQLGERQGLKASAADDDVDDEEGEELEAIEDLTVATIKARLKAREVPFASNASKDNLYQLLEDNWSVEG